MITIQHIADATCPDLLVGVYQREGREFIASIAEYPNGDNICAYLSIYPTGPALSDHGTTLRYLADAGIDLGEHRHATISYILNSAKMRLEEGALLKPLDDITTPGEALRSFCDAIGRISTLEFEREPHPRSLYVPKVDYVLRRRLEPQFKVDRKYFDPVADPDHLYPIDWALFTADSRKHIFAITGHDAALLMPATVHFLANHGIKVPTLALVAPDVRLRKRQASRIQHAAQEILFQDISLNESRVVEWAEKNAA